MRVLVVGAGISGRAVASRLVAKGATVKILETGDEGTGGRVGNVSQQADMGAQYCTARGDALYNRLMEEECVHAWRSRVGIHQGDAWHRMKSGGSLGAKVKRRLQRFVGVPNNAVLAQVAGSDKLLDIEYQRKVVEIERDNEGLWTATARVSGTVYSDNITQKYTENDVLILAVTPASVQALLNSAKSVTLDKDLIPEVSRVQMLPCWSMCVNLSYKLKGMVFDAGFINHSCAISWVTNCKTKPGSPLPPGVAERWIVHSTNEFALNCPQSRPKKAIMFMLEELFRICGKGINQVPVSTTTRFWDEARAVAGGLQCSFIADDENHLYVCGDWCHGSRIEGAYLSGIRLAEHLAEEPSTEDI